MTEPNMKEIGSVLSVKESRETSICYKLIKLDISQPEYLIFICDEEERAVIVAGEDGSAAEELFDVLVRETVSPCTANDIFKDMLCEK